MKTKGLLKILKDGPCKGMPRLDENRLKKLQTLPDGRVEGEGSIYESVEFEDSQQGVRMAYLYVAPSTQVVRHTHHDDMEFYITWDSDNHIPKYELCLPGESHELVNTSETRYACVVSIKVKVR